MTARGTLLLVLTLLTLAAGAAAAPPAKIIFPVLGQAAYTDDFGDARAGGVHQGIDIVAPKRNLALAAEAGKVEFWATSASAGCMLYLHGASGTTYNYIHLNNDLTAKNDNRGKCVAGTAYAKGLKNGSKVVAGQPVGYVGDSGDANGIHAHLHFELHPGGKGAVDPYAGSTCSSPRRAGRRSRSSSEAPSRPSPPTRSRFAPTTSVPGRCASASRTCGGGCSCWCPRPPRCRAWPSPAARGRRPI
jgi:murein DD-endopeptidase MepM/ murein hydrolase activator NlpD